MNLARKFQPPKNTQPQKPKKSFQEVVKKVSNEVVEAKRAKIAADAAIKQKAEEDATYRLIYGDNWEARDDIDDAVSAPPEQRFTLAQQEPEYEPDPVVPLLEARETARETRAVRRGPKRAKFKCNEK